MATKVYESVEVELLNGDSVTIRPLSIKHLRAVMKEWAKTQNIEADDPEDEFLNICMNCTAIAMRQFKPEYAEIEVLEDILDIKTMYMILEVAAELKLSALANDPKLAEAIQELTGQI